MKLLIFSLFFIFFSAEFLTNTKNSRPRRKPEEKLPAETVLLQKLTEEPAFAGKTLCFVHNSQRFLILKDVKQLQAATTSAQALKPAVSVVLCHKFLANFAAKEVLNFASNSAKGQRAIKAAKYAKKLALLLLDSVDGNQDVISRSLTGIFWEYERILKGIRRRRRVRDPLPELQNLSKLLVVNVRTLEKLARSSKSQERCWKSANRLLNSEKCKVRRFL